MAVEVTRLASGLTVITDPMPHLASATVGVWVDAGSRSEAEAEHGISHLLEHMAFKGTNKRSAQQIAEEIEAVGGEINAATSVETTSYYARILADDLELAGDILADILIDSRFDAEELEREQHVIVQEIGAAADAPEDKVFDLFQEAAFQGQPIGRPILGTEATVRGFRPGDLHSYLDRHYGGPGMILTAAGKVEHADMLRLADAAFGAIKSKAGPQQVVAGYRGGQMVEARDLQEVQVVLGFEGRPYGAPDYHATQLLAAVLGGGMSSRLFQEVREKRGLCYAVSAFHWGYVDTGLFGIHAATGEDDVAELIPVMLGEIERIAHDLSEAELNRAKAQFRAGLLMGLESPTGRASQNARQQLFFGRTFTTDEVMAKLNAVDTGDVRALAERLFTRSMPTLAAIGPHGKLPEVGAIAARLGSVAGAAA